jgi:putative GTP pyrophosphokinase
LLDVIHEYPTQSYPDEVEPILYCKSRIKAPKSMVQKLQRKGIPTDAKTALENTHDAVGVRVVCSFLDDVYKIRRLAGQASRVYGRETKDYIALSQTQRVSQPASGGGFPVFSQGKNLWPRSQVRTIAIDFWRPWNIS